LALYFAITSRPRLGGPVEGLNLALFVDAQHQGAIRRRQVEADDVAHFVDEERVARELEGLTPMRLQVAFLIRKRLREPSLPR